MLANPLDRADDARDASAQMPWVPVQDPVAPLPVMDLSLEFGTDEPMGPDALAPDGLRSEAWPLVGGRAVGSGGLRAAVQPGPAAFPVRRPDGMASLRLTLRLVLEDGSSVITELAALGEGEQQRAVLRCTVNRSPHDWLNARTLMAVVREVAASSAGARAPARRLHVRVYAMEGDLPPGVRPGYVPLAEKPYLPPLRTEHVLNIVATCSNAEPAGLSPHAPDGMRGEIWPITGGRFASHDGSLHGVVVAGGADYPHVRPDGVEWVEALYRLRSDDGHTIIIHNKGIYRDGASRLHPEFIATRGPHDWLNRSLFVGTLAFPVPAQVGQARDDSENDRLIQVHRVL